MKTKLALALFRLSSADNAWWEPVFRNGSGGRLRSYQVTGVLGTGVFYLDNCVVETFVIYMLAVTGPYPGFVTWRSNGYFRSAIAWYI